MIVFPLRRSVRLKAATASSRVETLPMFVRSRPSRTRWTSSLNWARSGTTTKSIVRPPAGRAEVESRLTAVSAPGADDVRAGLTCELGRHRTDYAGRAVHEDALPRTKAA